MNFHKEIKYIYILARILHFGKDRNFAQKSKICSKSGILLKHRNFAQTYQKHFYWGISPWMIEYEYSTLYALVKHVFDTFEQNFDFSQVRICIYIYIYLFVEIHDSFYTNVITRYNDIKFLG